MDAEQFVISEGLLRYWICGTIIRPLLKSIDKMNEIFSKVSWFVSDFTV